MSINRIKAILLQELFITKRSLEVIIDLPYFSIQTVVLFGFFALFLSGNNSLTTSQYLMTGLILWEIIRVTQYSVSVGSLWNIWSRNLSNMFITPLTLKEYMIAHMLSGAIKSLFIFIIISFITSIIFKFNILQLGILNLTLFFY